MLQGIYTRTLREAWSDLDLTRHLERVDQEVHDLKIEDQIVENSNKEIE